MSAYDDAIGRARGLLAEHGGGETDTRRSAYKDALVDLCALFDPDRPFAEAAEEASALIDFNPRMKVTVLIHVKNPKAKVHHIVDEFLMMDSEEFAVLTATLDQS